MNITQITQLSQEMLKISFYLAGPIIIAGMIVGVATSMVQAVTQVQEQSVGFVMKIMAAAVAFIFFAPWMLKKLLDFSANILGNLDKFVR